LRRNFFQSYFITGEIKWKGERKYKKETLLGLKPRSLGFRSPPDLKVGATEKVNQFHFNLFSTFSEVNSLIASAAIHRADFESTFWISFAVLRASLLRLRSLWKFEKARNGIFFKG
jgi:hypothetical protein